MNWLQLYTYKLSTKRRGQ